jgi:hypothetical protein
MESVERYVRSPAQECCHREGHTDEDTPLRAYTFDGGDLSRDLTAVTVRLDAARARLVLRDLQRMLAEQPDSDIVFEWFGTLRQDEAHEP